MRFLSLCTAGTVSLCGVCSNVIVLGLSVCEVVSVPDVGAVTVMRVLLFVLHVSMVSECEGARVTAMLVWGTGEVWLW